MARVNNLNDFLIDVASAIKTKKGSEVAIPAANFDTEILALPSQGTYEQRVLNVSTNGTQTITPSAGFDAIDELELTVAVPEKQLQSKTYNFTQNTTIQLLPDTGYDGFDIVTLNIEVPAESSGPIKMYSSVEEMLADVEEPEGEYGVVYHEEIITPNEGDTISEFTCSASVVLDEPITESIYWYDNSYNLNIDVDSTSARIQYYGGSSMTNINYTSDDGIHYNADADVEFILDEPITLSGKQPWNNVYSKFLSTVTEDFQGMWEWKDEIDQEYFDVITNITVNTSDNTFIGTNEQVYLPYLTKIIKDIYDTYSARDLDVVKENGVYVAYQSGQSFFGILNSAEHNMNLVVSVGGYNTTSYNSYKYTIDLESLTFSREEISNNITFKQYHSSTGYYTYPGYSIVCSEYVGHFINGSLRTDAGRVYYINSNNTSPYKCYSDDLIFGHVSFKTWHHVKTIFTLEFPYQLLPGIRALGKHGEIEGDGSIYNHIDSKDVIYSKLGIQNYNKGLCVMSTEEASGMSLKIVDGKSIENNTDGTSYMREVKGLFTIPSDIEILYVAYSENYIACLDKNHKIHFYNLNGEELHSIQLDIELNNSQYIWFDIYDVNGIITFFVTNRTYNGSSIPSKEWPLTYGYINTMNNNIQTYTLNVWNGYSYDTEGVIHTWYRNEHIYLAIPVCGSSSGSNERETLNVYKDGDVMMSLSLDTLSAYYNWYDGERYIYIPGKTVGNFCIVDLETETYNNISYDFGSVSTVNPSQYLIHDENNNLYVWIRYGNPGTANTRLYNIHSNGTSEIVFEPSDVVFETSVYPTPSYIKFLNDNSALLLSASYNRIGFISDNQYRMYTSMPEMSVPDKYGHLDGDSLIQSYGSSVLKAYSAIDGVVNMYILRPDLKITSDNDNYTLCKLNSGKTSEQIYLVVANSLTGIDYSNTVSPEEYTEAVSTTNEILGDTTE